MIYHTLGHALALVIVCDVLVVEHAGFRITHHILLPIFCTKHGNLSSLLTQINPDHIVCLAHVFIEKLHLLISDALALESINGMTLERFFIS